MQCLFHRRIAIHGKTTYSTYAADAADVANCQPRPLLASSWCRAARPICTFPTPNDVAFRLYHRRLPLLAEGFRGVGTHLAHFSLTRSTCSSSPSSGTPAPGKSRFITAHNRTTSNRQNLQGKAIQSDSQFPKRCSHVGYTWIRSNVPKLDAWSIWMFVISGCPASLRSFYRHHCLYLYADCEATRHINRKL